MKTKTAPYKAHLFICTKSRNGERKSCGDACGPALKAILKEEVKTRGLKPFVRVSESSCLGVCEAGPNIMIYPQQVWLSAVRIDDVPEILDMVGEFIGHPPENLPR